MASISKSVFLIFVLNIGLNLPSSVYAQDNILHQSGDNRENYHKNYKTNSLSLDYRDKNKKPFDLINNFQTPQLGLPPPPIVRDNLMTKDKINLGRKMFFDRRLSLNNTISCAMCHIPEHGFANNELATAVGIEGKTVRRNAPTIYNVAYVDKLFHDAREDSLELQVWSPLLAKNEMGNPSFSSLINKIKNLKDYQYLFEQAFDGSSASIITIGKALANYQRTLISANSNFDKWYYASNEKAMSKQAKLGFKLFTGKAGCSNCHSVNKKYALFTDNKLHNTGIGYLESMVPISNGYTSVQVAPGTYLDVENSIIGLVSEKKQNDLGLYEITENPNDRWKYKTPSLRNVALTAPYMHNGSLLTLKEVVDFYNKGGIKNEVLSPLIRPLYLNNTEVDALVDFLKNLTGDNVNYLIEDAFSAPVGDTTENSYN